MAAEGLAQGPGVLIGAERELWQLVSAALTELIDHVEDRSPAVRK